MPGASALSGSFSDIKSEVVLAPVSHANVAAHSARSTLAVGAVHGEAELMDARSLSVQFEDTCTNDEVVVFGKSHLAWIDPSALDSLRHPVHEQGERRWVALPIKLDLPRQEQVPMVREMVVAVATTNLLVVRVVIDDATATATRAFALVVVLVIMLVIDGGGSDAG